ncbi:MAG: Lar family restriction alleviation protein [Alphaproteobacteria bacterium]|uniref:Putative restriction alleviation protein n=1 Tax=viral metagenome TaxID=1070528 RepID=A0A6H1ZCN4_9ZZZZ|nr:Lar family restriction alleviation protein [Alphaproteobacteria bacterium]
MTAPSNANTSGLEACPFCGGEAWLNAYEAKYSDLPPKSRCPQCRSCGASLGYLPTPSKATEAWNRRVTAASAQARIGELEARIEYLRGSRDGHAAQAHAEFEKRVMATDALISAREALHQHYVDWDGEPEDAVPLQEARAECDRVLAALQQETQP